jgi:hypothetical protein
LSYWSRRCWWPGNFATAEQDLAHAWQANPHAPKVWFLRGYIAWKQRGLQRAEAIDTAHNARGRDWKPAGSALEGDVQRRMYSESGFLNVFEQQWDDPPELTRAYGQLDAYLRRLRYQAPSVAKRNRVPRRIHLPSGRKLVTAIRRRPRGIHKCHTFLSGSCCHAGR